MKIIYNLNKNLYENHEHYKITEIRMRKMQIKNLNENYEKNENPENPCDNHENDENPVDPYETQEYNENH